MLNRIGIGVFVILLVITAFFLGRSRPNQAVIEQIQKKIEQEYVDRIKEKEIQLSEKETEIANNLRRIERLEKAVRDSRKLIEQYEKEISNVKKPNDFNELKSRLEKLGYDSKNITLIR